MKKKLLSLFILAINMVANAQTESQVWWGYFSDANKDYLSYDGNIGWGSAGTLNAAIYVPANHAFVGGSTIKAIRLWLGDDVLTSVDSDMKVWISKTLPDNIDNSDYVQTVSKSSLKNVENEIELTTPFEVSNQAVYVGFSISTNKKSYPIMSYGSDIPNSFIYKVNNRAWEYLDDSGYGPLALQILLDGNNFPNNRVTVEDFGQNIVLKGDDIPIPVTFTNEGKDPVNSICYTIATEDGIVTPETKLSFGSLSLNQSSTKYLTFKSGSEAGKKIYTLNVTKVNDVANTAINNSGSGILITIMDRVPIVPVIEEFTATWCGYCPFGIEGMKKAREKYGDEVVLIAVHDDSQMGCDEYTPILDYAQGYPSAILNRKTSFYPNENNILRNIQNAKSLVAQGSIDIVASWADEEQKTIKFDTQSCFLYNDDDAHYGIAFVLTEDGLTDSNWGQANYLSGSSGNSNMSFWYSAGSSVYGLEFNHVPVAAWNIKNGISGSVPAKIKAGETQRYVYNGDISANKMIQNKSNLKAIALLIDQKSGTIVNAAQTDIQEYKKEPDALRGDANGDGEIGMPDVMFIVNYILGTPDASFNAEAADANQDGEVGMPDVMYIVNYILNGKFPEE